MEWIKVNEWFSEYLSKLRRGVESKSPKKMSYMATDYI